MSRHTLAFIYVNLLLAASAYGQPVNNLIHDVVVPPPNVASLGKFTEIPVDMANGIPSITIPIYTIQQGPLSVPISLDYHASGIRVAETASWVGTGWTLKSGGMVSRTVLGLPDEYNAGFYYTGANLNVTYGSTPSNSVCQSVVNNLQDGEPDMFSFNIPGYSGYFYINYLHQVVRVPEQDLIIKFNGNNQLNTSLAEHQRLRSFTITTPDGTIYHFGEAPGISSNSIEYVANSSVAYPFTEAPAAWHLLKIESYDKLHSIDYNYATETYGYSYQGSASETRYVHYTGYTINPTYFGSPSQIITLRNTSKRLSSIQTPQETIYFDAINDREDTQNLGSGFGKQLNKIRIQSTGTTTQCKQFEMLYDYFKATPASTNYQEKKLRLLNVQESACDGTIILPKYQLQYEGDMLPSTWSHATDHWGYYNGKDNNLENIPPTTLFDGITSITYGTADRETNETYMKRGVLKKMIYPTGGFAEFTTEANDYKTTLTASSSNLVSLSAPPCRSFDMSANLPAFTAAQLPTLQYYIKHIPPPYPLPSCPANSPVYTYTLQLFQTGNSTPITTYQFNYNAGTYEDSGNLSTLFPQIQANVSTYYVVLKASWSEQQFKIIQPAYSYTGNKKVGGLRISQVLINDGISALNDIKRTYSYTGTDGYSSGTLYGQPVYGRILGYTVNSGAGPPFNISVYQFTGAGTVPLSTFYGRHVNYSRVTEGHNGNGSITESYYGTSTPQPNTGYPAIPETIQPLAGKPSQSTTYNSASTAVQYETFTYDYTYLSGNDYFLRTVPFVISGSYVNGLPINTVAYAAAVFQTYSGYTLAKSKQVTKDGVTSKTDYFYNSDPVTYQMGPEREEMTNSDGKLTQIEYSYNYTYGDVTLKNDLISRNIIDRPWQIRKKVAGVEVDGTSITYGFFNLTTGNKQSSASGAVPRIYQHSRFQKTWDANGAITGSGNWLLGTIDNYDAKGFPKTFTSAYWPSETYEWEPYGAIKKRTYLGHTWEYTYYAGTRLVSSIKDVDDQITWFDYDKLQRLSKIWAKPGTAGLKTSAKLTTEYFYQYISLPSISRNYIRTQTTFATPPSCGGVSSISTKEIFEYIDGIGRLIQKVGKKESPAQKDVVAVTEYDKWGRKTKMYNPFEATTNTGAYAATIPGGTPFSLTGYENSPLSRITSETPPGWYATTTTYGTNTGNEVKMDLAANTYYPPNYLFKTTVTDPDNNYAYTYTDKKGRIVYIKKTNFSFSGVFETYNIYDDKDRLTKVVPPGSTVGNTTLNFTYLYDQADNIISQKIPDAAAVTMKYNARNLLVLKQDGNLAAQSKWECTQYDDYGRPIKSGLYSGTIPPVIPYTLAPTDLYNENIYGTTGIEKGKVKTAKSKAFDSGGTWLQTTYSYDIYGRQSGTTGNNYLLPADLNAETTSFCYDYADNLLHEVRNSKKTSTTTYSITQDHDYDHWGRNTLNKHKVGSGSTYTINQLNYDWKGQVIERNLGKSSGAANYLQSLDYTYNAQGWLQTINTPSLGGANIPLVSCPTVQSAINPGTASSTPDLNDLFYLDLKYDVLQSGLSSTAYKNGNISQAVWRIRGRERQAYMYTYDNQRRLTWAMYRGLNDVGAVTNNDQWNEQVSYDARGNISTFKRNAKYKASGGATCWSDGEIDNLTYTYNTNTNKIQKITDNAAAASKANGWHNIAGASASATFAYDNNGNLTYDPYKNLTIEYNYLNLPYRFSFLVDPMSDTYNHIEITYDGSGRKIRKVVKNNSVITYQQDYEGGIEYRSSSGVSLSLESIYHMEGRVFNTNVGTTGADALRYEYGIKDHLGNIRLTFTDKNGNGVVDVTTTPSTNEILQENQYYPFGLAMSPGLWTDDPVMDNQYRYNGKELNSDHGLGWYDYGGRWYDPTLARWWRVDPEANKYPSCNPYNYVKNNPLIFIDPTGKTVEPAPSLKGEWLAAFTELRASNETYNSLLSRYDVSSIKDDIHYRVGSGNRLNADDVAAFAHTKGDEGNEARMSPTRNIEALRYGTVTTNSVIENVQGMSKIGIVTTLIHEAVHAYLLAEGEYNTVNGNDQHVPFNDVLFKSTYEGLSEYNTENNLGLTDRQLKLLSANGLWGTDAVNQAFNLNPDDAKYEDELKKLKDEAKDMFFPR